MIRTLVVSIGIANLLATLAAAQVFYQPSPTGGGPSFTGIPMYSTSRKADPFNSVISRINYAISNARMADMEVVAEQHQQLGQLSTEFFALQQAYQTLSRIGDKKDDTVAQLKKAILRLEQKLQDDILLPHQSEKLQKKVFKTLVASNSGNVLQTLEEYYPGKIQLNERQKSGLKKISEKLNLEMQELQQQYAKDRAALMKKAKEQSRDLLTGDQKEKLGRWFDADL